MLDTNLKATSIIEGEFESETCMEQITEYNDVSVAHLIFSNYTWNNQNISQLSNFYLRHLDILAKIQKVQDNCDSEVFGRNLRKFGLRFLPIYSRAIDKTHLSPDSIARVYHDPREYLDQGSPDADELDSFVQSVLKACLEPIFAAREISNLLKTKLEFSKKLIAVQSKNVDIVDVSNVTNFEPEIIKSLQTSLKMRDICGLSSQINQSIIRFIVTFALHIIRTHLMCNFGIDNELKLYNRKMRSMAIADLAEAKKSAKPSVKSEKMVKSERNPRVEKRSFVKMESQVEQDDDDDFCEIIEVDEIPKRKAKVEMVDFDEKPTISKKPTAPSTSAPPVTLENEKKILEMMDEDPDLPDYVKWNLRLILENNQTIRSEISNYRGLTTIFINNRFKNQ